MLATAAFVLAQKVICIDPGHPSEVGSGTRGIKVTEIEAAWSVAHDLRMHLEAKGFHVVLTKTSEKQKVLNKRRAEIANESKADLMVRLHCDSADGSGFAVYYPSQQGSVDGFKGPSSAVIRQSKSAATKFHAAMHQSLLGKLNDKGLKTDLQTAVGAKQGALTGSIYSRVPVVLVEMVVLTNRKDEIFLASHSGREAMVEALEKGTLAAVK